MMKLFFYREKNKKYAEQAAAVACLTKLGIHDGRLDKGENPFYTLILKQSGEKVISHSQNGDKEHEEREFDCSTAKGTVEINQDQTEVAKLNSDTFNACR